MTPDPARTIFVALRTREAQERIWSALSTPEARESWLPEWSEARVIALDAPRLVLEQDGQQVQFEISEDRDRRIVAAHISPVDDQAQATSLWRMRLAALRFVLARELNPAAIHTAVRITIAAPATHIYPYFVYPQWQAEWLRDIELGPMLEGTRLEAMYEWPLVRGLVAMRTEPAPNGTLTTLEVRAWDALRLGTQDILQRLEASLQNLSSWFEDDSL